eukprot:TRINITY_DN6172_c0_g4_i1.p1 TRINITY_DN6172_c0_g4~~TRINITY_DN6172_c0_g4_i1.p1  ORF type:complete len:464 (+),score=116.42 TRINITY_DN6172_c0_g4_i1:68-1459(+)
MGPILSKPVTTKILERKTTPLFHIGVGYMNGFRDKMEDAHTIYHRDDWGFFGVFDGHCGPLCSEYVAGRFPVLLNDIEMPISDHELQEMSLKIDKEFLLRGTDGGSTGTFLTARKVGSKYKLQVANVGDSRIVLGRRAHRSSVSLTLDHKPTLTQEKARIEAAAGYVSNGRVDGSLAVSRAFGDATYKDQGEYHSKVIAVPEFMHIDDAEEGDFVLLCCDGVFESDVFCNESVIDFIFERLDRKLDLALIASQVCDEAMARGSKDNISAMIVQLGGELDCKEERPEHEVLAGPYNSGMEKFKVAYAGMAEKGGMDTPACVDLRFEQVREELRKLKEEKKCTETSCDFTTLDDAEMKKLIHYKKIDFSPDRAPLDILKEAESRTDGGPIDLRPVDVQEHEKEIMNINVPASIAALKFGSEERRAWFAEWSKEPLVEEDPLLASMGKSGLSKDLLMKVMSQAEGK